MFTVSSVPKFQTNMKPNYLINKKCTILYIPSPFRSKNLEIFETNVKNKYKHYTHRLKLSDNFETNLIDE